MKGEDGIGDAEAAEKRVPETGELLIPRVIALPVQDVEHLYRLPCPLISVSEFVKILVSFSISSIFEEISFSRNVERREVREKIDEREISIFIYYRICNYRSIDSFSFSFFIVEENFSKYFNKV